MDVEKGGEPLPFGCLNTFPFAAQRILRVDKKREIDVELIGYPGFSLVHPTEKEKEAGFPHGMQNAFFWVKLNHLVLAKERLSLPDLNRSPLGVAPLGLSSRPPRQFSSSWVHQNLSSNLKNIMTQFCYRFYRHQRPIFQDSPGTIWQRTNRLRGRPLEMFRELHHPFLACGMFNHSFSAL